MSKHTPGPWTVTTTYEHGKKIIITAGHAAEEVATVIDPANAHLLASAPALLDAAKQALDWLNADERTAWAKPSREYIATLLDAAIAAADPDFVC